MHTSQLWSSRPHPDQHPAMHSADLDCLPYHHLERTGSFDHRQIQALLRRLCSDPGRCWYDPWPDQDPPEVRLACQCSCLHERLHHDLDDGCSCEHRAQFHCSWCPQCRRILDGWEYRKDEEWIVSSSPALHQYPEYRKFRCCTQWYHEHSVRVWRREYLHQLHGGDEASQGLPQGHVDRPILHLVRNYLFIQHCGKDLTDCRFVYMFYGLFLYGYQGQYSISPSPQTVSPYWALVVSLISSTCYHPQESMTDL